MHTTKRQVLGGVLAGLSGAAGVGAVKAQIPSRTLTAADIVTRHIAARGGERALRALTSLRFDGGNYREPGVEGDGRAVMMLKRPYYKVVGHPLRNPDFLEGYDGAAWEWFGDPGITLRTVGAASGAIRHFADVEGPFLDYANKGSSVELVGEATIEGRRAHQLRLTMMDGYATDFFIDSRSFQIVASRHTAPIHAFGEAVTSENRFEDLRSVAGVLFPFRGREVELGTGRELNAMQWGRIEANEELPDAWFSPPIRELTPLQRFIEQLFVQRADAAAMLWTYHWFRRAHPEIDTNDAAQIAGYQALKMGDVAPATALLLRNASDQPASADAAFALGRAYAMGARAQEARAEFERALRLQPGHPRATRALAALPPSS